MAGDALMSRFGDLDNFLNENRAWRNGLLSLQLESPDEKLSPIYWDEIIRGVGADIYLGVNIDDLIRRRIALGFQKENAVLAEEMEAYCWLSMNSFERTPMRQKLLACTEWPPEWLTIASENEEIYNRRMEANLKWFSVAKLLQTME
jgi:hypothetical protein